MTTQKSQIVVATLCVAFVFTSGIVFGQRWVDVCPPGPPPADVVDYRLPPKPAKPLLPPDYYYPVEYRTVYSEGKTTAPPPPRYAPYAVLGLPETSTTGYSTTVETLRKYGRPVPPMAKVRSYEAFPFQYEDAVKAASSWRTELQVEGWPRPEVERTKASQLSAINAEIAKREFSDFEANALAQCTHVKNLPDVVIRLRVAAKVMREHDQELLAKRFLVEADWVDFWIRSNPSPDGIVDGAIYEWQLRVAAIWGANADALASAYLIKEEPFASLIREKAYDWTAALSAQGWKSWYGLYSDDNLKDDRWRYAIDEFYAQPEVKPDPWLWLKWKLVSAEFFDDLAPLRKRPPVYKRQAALNIEIEKLVKELVGE